MSQLDGNLLIAVRSIYPPPPPHHHHHHHKVKSPARFNFKESFYIILLASLTFRINTSLENALVLFLVLFCFVFLSFKLSSPFPSFPSSLHFTDVYKLYLSH